MPIEIRELKIKGTVSSNFSKRSFEERNSPLLNTQFINQLKKEIITECMEKLNEKLERQKSR